MKISRIAFSRAMRKERGGYTMSSYGPDMQISRIRLSDKTSRLHPRRATAAGRSLGMLAEATRIPAIQKTIDAELFEHGAAMGQASTLPDEPPRSGTAQPEFAGQSIVERAVLRLDSTVAAEMLPKTPRGLDHIVNEHPQPDPPNVSGASRLRFWRRAGTTRLTLIFCLCLASLLIAVLTGTGIFLLRQPSRNTALAESTPAEEIPEKAREGARSITAPAMEPPATGVVQGTALARPSPTAAPTSAATSTASTPPPPEPSFSATEIAAFLARGDALLATGDVASARLFYERAADSGEAQAAVRLAKTFDPVFLSRGRLRAVSGDLGMALFWYRRARDLGATEVERRLNTLETEREANNP